MSIVIPAISETEGCHPSSSRIPVICWIGSEQRGVVHSHHIVERWSRQSMDFEGTLAGTEVFRSTQSNSLLGV